MPTRKNKHFTKWQEIFNNDLPPDFLMTESMCRSLKKLMHECPHDVKLTDWNGLFETVFEVASREDIPITPEHEDKGRKWIKDQIRHICKNLTYSERELFEHANKVGIKHFYFGGYMDATNHRHLCPNRRLAVPIWTVQCKDGKRFSYAYGAWQGYDQVVVDPPSYL